MKDGRKVTVTYAGETIEFSEDFARRLLKRLGSAYYLEEI